VPAAAANEAKLSRRRFDLPFLDFEPTKVYSGHCTGVIAFQILKSVMGDVLEPIHTGSMLEV